MRTKKHRLQYACLQLVRKARPLLSVETGSVGPKDFSTVLGKRRALAAPGDVTA